MTAWQIKDGDDDELSLYMNIGQCMKPSCILISSTYKDVTVKNL